MSSDTDYDAYDLNPADRSKVGRTFWDVLVASRIVILIIVLAIFICIGGYLIYSKDPGLLSRIIDAVIPYSSLVIFLFFGWVLCKFTFKRLYVPVSRLALWLNLKTGTVRLIRIPEARFRMMNTVGDSVLFRGVSGIPVYLVTSVTEEKIDFGWIHSARPEIVFAERELFLEWRELLEDVLKDNIRLMADPEILAAEMTRQGLKDVVAGFAKALGITRVKMQKETEKIDHDVKPQSEPEYGLGGSFKEDDEFE
jgi:hypothetical protein